MADNMDLNERIISNGDPGDPHVWDKHRKLKVKNTFIDGCESDEFESGDSGDKSMRRRARSLSIKPGDREAPEVSCLSAASDRGKEAEPEKPKEMGAVEPEETEQESEVESVEPVEPAGEAPFDDPCEPPPQVYHAYQSDQFPDDVFMFHILCQALCGLDCKSCVPVTHENRMTEDRASKKAEQPEATAPDRKPQFLCRHDLVVCRNKKNGCTEASGCKYCHKCSRPSKHKRDAEKWRLSQH